MLVFLDDILRIALNAKQEENYWVELGVKVGKMIGVGDGVGVIHEHLKNFLQTFHNTGQCRLLQLVLHKISYLVHSFNL